MLQRAGMDDAIESEKASTAGIAASGPRAGCIDAFLTWARSWVYHLEWKDEHELLLRVPSSERQTVIQKEQVDYVLARLFGP